MPKAIRMLDRREIAEATGETWTQQAENEWRHRLNELCGMPRKNRYPAFREGVTIQQVRLAVSLLEQAQAAATESEARQLRYEAERAIYPQQSRGAVAEAVLGLVGAARGEARKAALPVAQEAA